MNIDDHEIPAGTMVGASPYAIYHNEGYFDSPWVYKPERWLVSPNSKATKDSVHATQLAFCPFCIGPRGRFAKSMAYMELMTTLAGTVLLFDMELASKLGEGSPDMGFGRDRETDFSCVTTL
jgi:cytochrome P450